MHEVDVTHQLLAVTPPSGYAIAKLAKEHIAVDQRISSRSNGAYKLPDPLLVVPQYPLMGDCLRLRHSTPR